MFFLAVFMEKIQKIRYLKENSFKSFHYQIMHMLIQSSPAYYDTTVDLYLRAYEVEGSRIARFCTYFCKKKIPGRTPAPLAIQLQEVDYYLRNTSHYTTVTHIRSKIEVPRDVRNSKVP